MTITLRLNARACPKRPWKKAAKARVLPQAGQAGTSKRWLQRQRPGPRPRFSGEARQKKVIATARIRTRGIPAAKVGAPRGATCDPEEFNA